MHDGDNDHDSDGGTQEQQRNQKPGQDAILRQWLHYGQIVGRQVRFAHAPHSPTGIVVGLDKDGALLVQQAAGVQRRVIAGEVTFVSTEDDTESPI